MRIVHAALIVLLLPAVGAAQPRPFAVSERPAAGLFGGFAANADVNSGGAAPQVAFVFDTPVTFGARVRLDVARTGWTFEQRDANRRLLFRDHVDVRSIRVVVLKVTHLAPRLASYIGTGYGVYSYDYHHAPLQRPWHGGVHLIAGLERTSHDGRYALDGEARVQAIEGPGLSPVLSAVLLTVDAAVGVKVRF